MYIIAQTTAYSDTHQYLIGTHKLLTSAESKQTNRFFHDMKMSKNVVLYLLITEKNMTGC